MKTLKVGFNLEYNKCVVAKTKMFNCSLFLMVYYPLKPGIFLHDLFAIKGVKIKKDFHLPYHSLIKKDLMYQA